MAIGPERDVITRTPVRGGATAAEIDVGLRAHMQKVFGYMAGGVGLSGLVAFFLYQNETFLQAIFASKPLFWLAVLGPIGLGFVLILGLRSMRAATAQMMFWVYSAAMGSFLAIATLPYTGESVVRALFVSAAMFAGVALYGYTTKRDLTSWGSFLFMGLLGLIIASVVNLFLASSALYWATSVIGVIIFTGLTAYDTQKIKEAYWAGDDAETGSKKAIWGALELYLDFINLFLYLLRFLGDRR